MLHEKKPPSKTKQNMALKRINKELQSVFNNLIAIESALLRLLEELILQNQVHRV